MTIENKPLQVAVIIPAWNALATIDACLSAIHAQSYPISECILFDDGSTDATAEVAARHGARVVGHKGAPIGPANGRNRAAAVTKADLLFFVDADVVLAPDALEKLVAPFSAHDVVGAFGSYDTNPPSRRLSSIYVNLRHHFTHQMGDREASTFWSGVGLIRRQPFLALGGFDAALFPHPSIEDVELGARIIASGGRIRLVPEAQGAHWKDWRLKQLLHADIFRRALPWSMLIVEGRAASSALNLSQAERLKALLSGGVFLMLMASLLQPAALFGAVILFGVYVVANRHFLGLVRRQAGLRAARGAAGLHCCYHFYASATFALVMLAGRLGLLKSRSRPAGTSGDTSLTAGRHGS
jgi:glycosyltransferase involved in cell wall biosynthesis